jgi:sec-independent protein translocase protein TatA
MFEGLFQPMHLIMILFIALVVFGPKKLPELGMGLGDGIRSFKDSMRDTEESVAKSDGATTSVPDTREIVSGHNG